MQKILFSAFTVCVLVTSLARAATVVDRSDLTKVFEAQGLSGSFALLDVNADRLTVVNQPRAHQRFIPASTFKIANSLIALELGVVADNNEIIPYGGEPQPIRAWENDMTLGEAFAVSNVPVFQEIARRVGLARYSEYLADLDYGNGAFGTEVDRFWLAGPLEISAVEQVKFLSLLAQKQLPLSDRTQDLVQDIARIETKDGAVLYGKTGWTTAPDPDIGWFVGWVVRDDGIYAFALNIDMRSRADAPLRRVLARQLLAELGVY
ncbi:MAG: class D beta-lactamase [Rhodobacteraceae bacterium]|nr:class D beta-lactamase [Paracoccaceae bacterium]